MINQKKVIRTTTVAMAGIFIALAAFVTAHPAQNANAELVAQPIVTWTLKSEPTTVQLVGSGNYNDWHYVIMSTPSHGTLLSYDGLTGQALYQPNAGFTGIDSFTYRLVKNMNTNWYSATVTVKIAVVEPCQFCSAHSSVVDLANYFKAKNYTPANAPEVQGVTNLEPRKATADGSVAYTNAKIAITLSGQDWYSFSLGQRAYMMDNYCNLLNKSDMWFGYVG